MTKRLNNTRQKMAEMDLEAVLITHPPNIFYLSGFSGSSGYLLLTDREALLYTDFRYIEQAAVEAPFFEIIQVKSAVDYAQLATFVSRDRSGKIGLEEAHLTLRAYRLLQKEIPGIELLPLNNFIEEVRAVKEESEVKLIARAAQIADEAWRDLWPRLKPGISEREVSDELEFQMRKRGAERLAFETIVASGERSALPHGVAGSKIIEAGELITVDFGAVFNGYHSDMTRTFLFGEPTAKQSEIYTLVLTAQEMVLQSIRAGQKCADVDAMVRQYFQQQGYGAYFGHGLGHGVGLEIHELPTLAPSGQGVLQERMVFTVEPGLYIPEWGGVRIEDSVVLDSTGAQILTKSEKRLVYG
ncbi:MAG: aminopeptidase P family protein [Firmicutes bacterium]|nr:aminopeptidase P family protein [Bacillota bacterium]